MGLAFFAPVISIGFNLIASALFQPTIKRKQPEPNPRVPKSQYGAYIAKIYGTVRIEGNKIFPDSADKMYFKETVKESSGGGKGGGGQRTETERTLVFGTFATLFCQGNVNIERVIINGRSYTPSDEFYQEYIEFFDGTQTAPWSQIALLADPPNNQIEYRNLAYLGIADLPCEPYGNQIPQQVAAVLTDQEFGTNPRLDLVMQDICTRAGLNPADIDVTELANDFIEGGLLVQETGEGYRSVIESLMQIYLFTAFEDRTGKIVFKKLIRPSFTAIPVTALELLPITGATGKPCAYKKTPGKPQNLPNKIAISFADIEKEYDSNKIYEDIPTFYKENNVEISTQLSTYSAFLRRKSVDILRYNYVTQLITYNLKFTARAFEKYPQLDLLEILLFNDGTLAQIQQISPGNDFTIEVVAKLYEPSETYVATVPPPSPSSGTVATTPLIPDLYVLDCPAFNGFTPNALFFFATSEATIETSTSNFFTNVTRTPHLGTSSIYTILTTLPPVTGEVTTADTLDIEIISGAIPEAYTGSDFDGDRTINLLYVAADRGSGGYTGEFIRYSDVTPLGGNQYRLSGASVGGMRRGLFGSFPLSDHATYTPNELGFLFYNEPNTAYFSFLRGDNTFIGTQLFHRPVVSAYQDLGSTPITSGTVEGLAYTPPQVTNVNATKDESGNVKLTWDYDTSFSSYVNGTEQVNFEIDVIDGTVVRTLSASIEEVFYTIDQITADGTSEPFTFEIFAVSNIVGRGYGLTVTVTPTLESGIDFATAPNADIVAVKRIQGSTTIGTIVNYIVPLTEDRYQYILVGATVSEFTNFTFPSNAPIGFQVYVLNEQINDVGARIKVVAPGGFAPLTDYSDVLRGGTAIVTHLGGGVYTVTGNNLLNYLVNGVTITNVIKRLNFFSSDSSVNIAASGADLIDIDFTTSGGSGDTTQVLSVQGTSNAIAPSLDVIFTATTDTQLKSLLLYNDSGITQDTRHYVRVGGTLYQVDAFNLKPDEEIIIDIADWQLSTGDTVELDSDSGSINYVLGYLESTGNTLVVGNLTDDTLTTVYTTTATTRTQILTIKQHNIAGSSYTVDFNVQGNLIKRKFLNSGIAVELEGDRLFDLNTGDTIQLKTDNTSGQTNYFISLTENAI